MIRIALATLTFGAGILACPATTKAQVDPYTAVTFIAAAFEEGKKWQQSQSWGKFRAARYGRPIIVGNLTSVQVDFQAEGENCESTGFSIAPGETFTISCDSTDGNGWFQFSYNGAEFGSIGEGGSVAWGYNDAGQIEPFDYTEDVRQYGATHQ